MPCRYASVAEAYGGASSAPTAMEPTTISAAKAPSSLPLHIRIARHFRCRTGMGHRPRPRRPNLVGVLPQIPAPERAHRRFPRRPPLSQLRFVELDVENAALGIDHNDVAVAEKRDRTAQHRLRPHMADAETARGAGEAAVGDQR